MRERIKEWMEVGRRGGGMKKREKKINRSTRWWLLFSISRLMALRGAGLGRSHPLRVTSLAYEGSRDNG